MLTLLRRVTASQSVQTPGSGSGSGSGSSPPPPRTRTRTKTTPILERSTPRFGMMLEDPDELTSEEKSLPPRSPNLSTGGGSGGAGGSGAGSTSPLLGMGAGTLRRRSIIIGRRKSTFIVILLIIPFVGISLIFLSLGRSSSPNSLSVTSRLAQLYGLTTGRMGSSEAPYVNTFQGALPRRKDYLRRARDWSEAELNVTRKGVDRLRETLPGRWRPDAPGGLKSARTLTFSALDRLSECLHAVPPTCTAHQTEIILAGSFHFGASHVGYVSGEDIWARSSIDAFNALGYTVLYAWDMLETLDIYLGVGDMVKVVIMEHGGLEDCTARGIEGYERLLDASEVKGGGRIVRLELTDPSGEPVGPIRIDPESQTAKDGTEVHTLMEQKTAAGFVVRPMGYKAQYGHQYSHKEGKLDKTSPDYEVHERWRCIKSPGFEEGIPAWKIFGFHFWANPIAKLGHLWTLSPEDYASYPSNAKGPLGYENNFYLGYSIEEYCPKPIPQSERIDQAYILAKQASYFDNDGYHYSRHVFHEISQYAHIEFVAGAGKKGDPLPDKGVRNLGQMSPEVFEKTLGKSKVLVGIGRPFVSPTPYEALCMGIPFINPIINWNPSDPDDSTQWTYQHEGLATSQPPNVYTVWHGNETQLEDAVVAAVENPIDRYIPPRMRHEAVRERHEALVSIDWRALAEVRMAEMVEEGQKVLFSL